MQLTHCRIGLTLIAALLLSLEGTMHYRKDYNYKRAFYIKSINELVTVSPDGYTKTWKGAKTICQEAWDAEFEYKGKVYLMSSIERTPAGAVDAVICREKDTIDLTFFTAHKTMTAIMRAWAHATAKLITRKLL